MGGTRRNFGGPGKFKALRTNFGGKIQDKNALVPNQTDLVELSRWFPSAQGFLKRGPKVSK